LAPAILTQGDREMAIKIKGYNFVMVEPARKGGTNRGFSPDDVVFATDITGNNSNLYALRIGLPVSAAKAARIKPGDKVKVGFDKPNKCVLVQWNREGDYTVSKGSGSRLYIKFNVQPGMPTVTESCGCPCEADDEGIVFMLPDCVSFDRNLRAEADAKK
jgi:hypothetical protein